MKTFFLSFVYATKGIISAVRSERNLRFHLVAAFYSVWLAFLFELSHTEFMILFIAIALVISAELFNTAIEEGLEKPEVVFDERIGRIKDIAAAAVLTNAVVAAIIGIVLFFDVDKLISIGMSIPKNPVFLVAFILSLPASYMFVFKFKER